MTSIRFKENTVEIKKNNVYRIEDIDHATRVVSPILVGVRSLQDNTAHVVRIETGTFDEIALSKFRNAQHIFPVDTD